jgi:hypothetical protein
MAQTLKTHQLNLNESQQQLKETGITDNQRLNSNIIRDRIENNLFDFEYRNDRYQGNVGDILHPIKKMKSIIVDNKKEDDFLTVSGNVPENSKTHKDLLSLYLGKPQKYNTTKHNNERFLYHTIYTYFT